jgi:hypothetical protein
MVIIPEEAELVIPLIRDAEAAVTYLLTYAAPVTRKMLHFNKLGYYAVPALPSEWKPPTWLTIEVGILAGRLYFDFDEYGDICKYLGVQEDDRKLLKSQTDATALTQPPGTVKEAGVAVAEAADATEVDTGAKQRQLFTAKPLTFLQEWLAIRRKGQDFTHTPMGYICQRKLLTASHPFFSRFEDGNGSKRDATRARKIGGTGGALGLYADGGVASDSEFDEDDGYLEGGDDGLFEDELDNE